MQELFGPSYGPVSGQKARSVVVLLHGYGADGHDLMPLAEAWAEEWPHTLFVMPHAPSLAYPPPSSGRQWFGLQHLDAYGTPEESVKSAQILGQDIEKKVTPLVCFLENLIKKNGLLATDAALMGFSQGAMMALYTGLYHFPAAGILSYSGIFCPHFQEKKPFLTPVCLIHGEEDTVIPFHWFQHACSALTAEGIPLESVPCPRLGHGIDAQGQKKGAEFLKKIFEKGSGSCSMQH